MPCRWALPGWAVTSTCPARSWAWMLVTRRPATRSRQTRHAPVHTHSNACSVHSKVEHAALAAGRFLGGRRQIAAQRLHAPDCNNGKAVKWLPGKLGFTFVAAPASWTRWKSMLPCHWLLPKWAARCLYPARLWTTSRYITDGKQERCILRYRIIHLLLTALYLFTSCKQSQCRCQTLFCEADLGTQAAS